MMQSSQHTIRKNLKQILRTSELQEIMFLFLLVVLLACKCGWEVRSSCLGTNPLVLPPLHPAKKGIEFGD